MAKDCVGVFALPVAPDKFSHQATIQTPNPMSQTRQHQKRPRTEEHRWGLLALTGPVLTVLAGIDIFILAGRTAGS